MNNAFGTRNSIYNIYAKKNSNYDYLYANYGKEETFPQQDHDIGVILSQLGTQQFQDILTHAIDTKQYNANAGIKKFGDEGVAAVVSELQQMHDLSAIKPVVAGNLTSHNFQTSGL
jgi:hypothetical protein